MARQRKLRKVQYITGKGYGVFKNGQLVDTSIGVCGALGKVWNRTLRKGEENAEYMIDYIPLEQVDQLSLDGLALFAYTGQIDESLCEQEHLPMKANREIAKNSNDYRLYKYE